MFSLKCKLIKNKATHNQKYWRLFYMKEERRTIFCLLLSSGNQGKCEETQIPTRTSRLKVSPDSWQICSAASNYILPILLEKQFGVFKPFNGNMRNLQLINLFCILSWFPYRSVFWVNACLALKKKKVKFQIRIFVKHDLKLILVLSHNLM